MPTALDYSKNKYRMAILMFLGAIAASSCTSLLAQGRAALSGVVKDASGEPVAGAYVKIAGIGSPFSFMVVSQAKGVYSATNLLPGKYTVRAIGAGHQSATMEIEAATDRQAKQDAILDQPLKINPSRKRMTEAEYERLMPEGEAKQILTTRCLICHGMEQVASLRLTRQQWAPILTLMRVYMKEQFAAVSDQERDLLLDYLEKNYGPGVPRAGGDTARDPNTNLDGGLAKGEGLKYVAMEFKLQRNAHPHDIAVDSRGNAWVAERTTNTFGKFDPASMTYTRIALPPSKFPETALNAIAVGPEDMVWAMDNSPANRLIQYNSKSREFNTFDIPAPPNMRSSMNTIRFEPDGTVWGTGISSNRILKMDPKTRKVTEFQLPQNSQAYGLAFGGDGKIWYVANHKDEIVKLDPATGKLTAYPVPTRGSDVRRMAADSEGNLWAGAHDASALLKVDYKTGKIAEYSTPTPFSGPYSVDVDTKRNLIWFSERYADKIGRFDPRTNTMVEFPVPNSNSDIRRIEIDRSHPNRIWWAGWGADRIGYIEVNE